MELKMKEKSYYSTIGMMGFREFLISEESEIDRAIDSVRNRIQLKKKQILLKQLDRALTIIDDKARTY